MRCFMQQTIILPSLQGGELPGFGSSNGRSSGERSSNQITEVRLVPPDEIGGKILWAHPDGYFLNAQGQKLAHNFNPAMQRGYTAANPSSGGNYGSCYPIMTRYNNRNCHILMALAFYGPRPTFENTSVPLQGKGQERGSYVGICHHLIPDKRNYRPDNLLCWLTREQHREADRRQRALRKVTPEGDLSLFPYARLRQLQDPRVTSREEFEAELKAISACMAKLVQVDPHEEAAKEPRKHD